MTSTPTPSQTAGAAPASDPGPATDDAARDDDVFAQADESPRLRRSTRALARGLGWFSIGLGLAEVLMPRAMARATGMPGRESLVRAYGLREIATGVGLLVAKDPSPWLWARVAGDALDLATLGSHVKSGRSTNALLSIAAVAGVAAVDAVAARNARRDAQGPARPLRDYSDRRGLPLPPDEMRGAALVDFEAPDDFVTPAPLRRQDLH